MSEIAKTASDAKTETQANINNNINSEVESCNKSIESAIKLGKYTCDVFMELSAECKSKLTAKGYTVSSKTKQNTVNYSTISWSK